jgi:hypothetical protein
VNVVVLHVADCPSLAPLLDDLRAIAPDGEAVTTKLIGTEEEARVAEFKGSPTILIGLPIDGLDPFESPGGQVGLACRLYPTEVGPRGYPSKAQLEAVLRTR